MDTYPGFNSEHITKSIIDSLSKIEESLRYKVMFGAVGGSYSFGLQNDSSDIDCYFVLESDCSLHFVKKLDLLIQGEQLSIDAMCVSYRQLLNEIDKFGKIQKCYPTILYRTKEEHAKNIGRKDIERPDFKRSILFRILLSDQIIGEETAKRKSEEFTDGILIRDIIDYQFTRIYGNYREAISQKKFVPVRKYLYTVHEICTSVALMNSPQKPAMDFIRLINSTVINKVVKKKILDFYGINKCAAEGKGKVLVPQCLELDRFIVNGIDEIYHYLKTNMRNNERLQI